MERDRDDAVEKADRDASQALREAKAEQPEEAKERTPPSAVVVYTAILAEGKGELDRPSVALFWSGLAAGLSMGIGIIAMGALASHLPDEPWQPLIVNLGYSLGFLAVVLGREQLFTENTLTGVLPLLARPDRKTFANVARLWTVVLAANLLGALAFAFAVGNAPFIGPEMREELAEFGSKLLAHDTWTLFLGAIVAGWLVALMVWLLPAAADSKVAIIILLTYTIGIGGFGHIIAGSIEVLYLVAVGQASVLDYLFGFGLPVLLGNVAGGVILVSLLNFGQLRGGSPP